MHGYLNKEWIWDELERQERKETIDERTTEESEEDPPKILCLFLCQIQIYCGNFLLLFRNLSVQIYISAFPQVMLLSH